MRRSVPEPATEQLPPGDRQRRPTAVAVHVLGDYQPEPQFPQPPAPWPLAQDPATSGATCPCTVFEGDGAAVLLDALTRANARTPWMVGADSVRWPSVPSSPASPAARTADGGSATRTPAVERPTVAPMAKRPVAAVQASAERAHLVPRDVSRP